MMAQRQGVGRRRDGRVGQAVLAATRELLAEAGYGALTVDAVATRARVGKAAIYRRYATKQEMVFAAALHDLDLQPPQDTGSLRGDLAALIGDIVTSLANPVAFAAIPHLLAEIHVENALGRRLDSDFVAAERASVTEVLRRAGERGEIQEAVDPDLIHALLLGPVFAWLFILRRDPSTVVLWLTDAAVRALSTTAGSTGST